MNALTRIRPIVPIAPETLTESVMSRFWSKVALSTECALWTANVNADGYGQFWLAGKVLKAHRVAWVWANGTPVPDGLVLDHLCRTPRCVAPNHLEPVVQRQNILRGEGITADQARRTECPNGHALAGDNLLQSALVKGNRICVACGRARASEQYALLRSARTLLGLSESQYVAAYGRSRAVARQIIERGGA